MIVAPLIILGLIALFSSLGLGSTVFGDLNADPGNPDNTIYYDSSGHAVIYANMTVIGEGGKITQVSSNSYAYWDNGTWTSPFVKQTFPLYWDTEGNSVINFADVGKSTPSANLAGYSLTTALGFIALILGLMALALIVGLRVFGIGTTAGNMVVICTGFLSLWGVFSGLALSLITAIYLVGPALYFFLTLFYTIGIIQQISSQGDA